ncbi:MAG: hypothetical protein R2695_01620 [Acidimicrobiales bacterium]
MLAWDDAAFALDGDRLIVDATDPAWAFERYANPVMSLAIAAASGAAFHCFAVATEHGTAAVMGGSGYGKTSIGRELLARGGRLVCDDLLAFDVDGAVRPGPAFVRTADGNDDDLDPGGKHRRTVAAVHDRVDIDVVVVLTREVTGLARVERQLAAVDTILEQVYSPIAATPEVREVHLRRAVDLATRAEVWWCERHHDTPARLADRIGSILPAG